MSAIAVFMMVVTIILVWGGLVASTVLLKVLPNTWESQEEESSSHKE
ncbi:methionine/alanine import family NSS transporter small subunit [Schaalia cardiffensis]|uniref:Methionine/alanine importer small subunit n=1 Tax=Schaalia cardiffensis F0333 TaxID=888050 RepID=N6X2M3_9ACTO|nr:methionine/alanine import family NSS transporter small subunit [Schaalia cardiffensis]ENO17687.1 hypothetical protein HMPREF9004_1597 [Schaalia cardiffensis F0333]